MTAPYGKDGQRFLALWFPYLGTERIWRQRLGRAWRTVPAERRPPLAVSRPEGGAWRIAALDEQAEACRLKRGMGLADARAMNPGLDIVEADPAADRRLLEGLADWCDRYTPLVALDGEDGLHLDITGCTHLFGGEAALLETLRAGFTAQGFDVRAGLASTPGAAWALARFRPFRIVPPGGEEEALAGLPMAALRLDAKVCQGLESVGLRVAGMLFSAPRAPLARRFGARLLLRLDQATGRVEEAVSPRRAVAPVSAERRLAEPICRDEDVEELAFMLATSVVEALQRRGEGATLLELALFRVDGAVSRVAIAASRPLREASVARLLLREKLQAQGGIDPGYGFDLMRLSALSVVPCREVQTDLAGEAMATGDDIALLADRIRARLGSDALLRPVDIASHLPERAVALVPFGATDKARVPADPTSRPERPIRLLRRPEPVEVAAEVPEGPPLHFRWRRALHRIARAEGPERIAPEWWREPDDARTRDYFRVEDDGGRRFWLYRQGLYGEAGALPRWFMHGVFA